MSDNSAGDKSVIDETLYYLKPQERLDLTNCDREPIHIISHVQPHGALLALNPADMTILQASENTLALFGIAAPDLLGRNVDILLVPERVEELRQNAAEGRIDANPLYLFSAPLAGRGPFHILAHVYREVLLVEVEAITPDDNSPDYYGLIKKTLTRFAGTATVRTFAQTICEEIRQLTGFDRVMVYKFLEDQSGEVIAEDLAPEQSHQESYLGLHYPAGDIPKQARALYLLNEIRMMPDVAYKPSPLIPAINPLTGRPLDMSYAFLRGKSVMCTQYLLNMGPQASMSMAIVKGGELWGLISCHHYAPRRVAYDVRTACEFVARVVSLQIVEKEANEEAEYRRHIDDMQHHFIERMARQGNLLSALADFDPNILSFVQCNGCAVLLGGECRRFGDTPDDLQIRALTQWLATTHSEQIYATSMLPSEFPEAEAFKTTACGLMALPIAYSGGGYILWFRTEVAQTVSWAGASTKGTGTAEAPLTPRASFALWQETVHGAALTWKPIEIEAARRLRVSVIEAMARMVEDLVQANMDLEKSNLELDSFAYIASHDLKEPLRGIHNFSHFLKEDYGELLPVEGQNQIDTILKLTKRMEMLIDSLLHYSQVGRQNLTYQDCDLNQLLQEVLEALHLRLKETRAQIRLPRPLPRLSCDRVQIGEIFHNLIYNALKYNDKETKWVEIGYSLPETDTGASPMTFFVRDNGIGIALEQQEDIFRIFKRLHGRDEYGGGTGAGLTIARKIVERHQGSLRVESTPGLGSTFYFTLPQEPQ
jgi:chemotaxis family two-component system sensor kinase Cph1